VVLVINSVIGVYYYLRVVTTMFMKEENEKFDIPQNLKLISGAGLTLLIVAAIILWIGILPSSLIEMIRNVVASI
jgi:NADH-quinone oxidoreductase subunit N